MKNYIQSKLFSNFLENKVNKKHTKYRYKVSSLQFSYFQTQKTNYKNSTQENNNLTYK